MPGYTVSDVRPSMRSGRPAMEATIRSAKRSSSGRTLYLIASSRKAACISLSLSGSCRGKIVGAAEVFRRVVQLPSVLAERTTRFRFPRQLVLDVWRTSHPCKCHGSRELVILDRVRRLRLGVIEGVEHAHPLHGLLRKSIDHRGLRQAYRLQHGRGDVVDVVVLTAYLASRLDPLRPGNDRAIGDAAIAGVELRLRERCIVGDATSRWAAS